MENLPLEHLVKAVAGRVALGIELIAVAWAPDQVIEGLELADHSRFVLGVQWHPEELVGHSEPARRLFTALVRSARS